MFQIAVVGTGFIGLSHIAAHGKSPDAKVVAVVDINAEAGEAAAKEAGCNYYSTLEEALEKESIDVVDVCLPTVLHEEFTIKAANAGKHVLCEKPVTFTMDSVERMIGACNANNVQFMVAQVARWWPEFATIKEHIDAGKLGKPRFVYEKRLAQHPNWTQWHKDPNVSGGGLYDMNIHDIDFLYTLYGLPETVYASGWKSNTGCWDHVATTLTWADGAKAVCETSSAMTGAFPFSIEFRGSGDDGTICYSFTAGHNIKDGDAGASFMWYPIGDEDGVELSSEQVDMFEVEIQAFLDAIKNGVEPPVTKQQTKDVLSITLAIKKSLDEGVLVTL